MKWLDELRQTDMHVQLITRGWLQTLGNYHFYWEGEGARVEFEKKIGRTVVLSEKNRQITIYVKQNPKKKKKKINKAVPNRLKIKRQNLFHPSSPTPP